jgi:short-subunit dehydrogenase
VIGASAGVGRALSEALAAGGYDLVLAARDARDLDVVAADLRVRHGATVTTLPLDLVASDPELDAWFESCAASLPVIDAVLVPAGGAQAGDDHLVDPRTADAVLTTNFVAVMKLANRFLAGFEARGRGTLVLFSSIAAAAPRRRNVAYAAAKSALESYARSMQHAFAGTDILVQVYALGYVDTSQARGQQLRLPATPPARVAEVVVRNLHRPHRFGYVPRYWAPVVAVLRRLPWPVYRRLAF